MVRRDPFCRILKTIDNLRPRPVARCRDRRDPSRQAQQTGEERPSCCRMVGDRGEHNASIGEAACPLPQTALAGFLCRVDRGILPRTIDGCIAHPENVGWDVRRFALLLLHSGVSTRYQPTGHRPVDRIRSLVVSSLYPSSARPRHGIFIENRIRHLAQSAEVDLSVVAPVPWFPLKNKVFRDYAAVAKTPRSDRRFGIDVKYPRYPSAPYLSMYTTPFLMAQSIIHSTNSRHKGRRGLDIIDAYYFYPDGVAAAIAANRLGVPFVVSALGNDLSLLPKYSFPRRKIASAAQAASHITTVCMALTEPLKEMGISDSSISVVLHGVDHASFSQPKDRSTLKKELGIKKNMLLSVGHLIERKGHHIIIDAMRDLQEFELWIAGDGPMERLLRSQAHAGGVADRVTFLGHVNHEELSQYYGAADALVLASSREGIANVLLEAMACGTPVVATNVWGSPEVVNTDAAGVLVKERSAAGIVRGVRTLFAAYPDRGATRRHAEAFTWEKTTRDHLAVLRKAIQSYRGRDGR